MTVKLSDRAREDAIGVVTKLAKHPDGAKMDDFRNALEMTDGQIRGVIANAGLLREGSKKYASYRAPAGTREKRAAAPPVKKAARVAKAVPPVGAKKAKTSGKKPAGKKRKRGAKK